MQNTQQQLQALKEHLKPLGLDLPNDTTEQTLIRDLLIACKTAAAMRAKVKSEQGAKRLEKDENPDSPVFEDKGQNNTMQFSIGDVESEVDAGPDMTSADRERAMRELKRVMPGAYR
jgi:hypothetical protein